MEVGAAGAGLLRAPNQLQAIGQSPFQLGLAAGHPALGAPLGLAPGLPGGGLLGPAGLSGPAANLMAHPLLGLTQTSSGNMVLLPRLP